MNSKPLGIRNYGSIPHLKGSRTGDADRHISAGQEYIATVKARDKHDVVIVQEKLDGSNVGVALKDGRLYALTRSGYEAKTSPYAMHHAFHDFVFDNEDRFREVLRDGYRLCGEWLHTAHGTIYDLPHEPFVAFDLIDKQNKRLTYDDFSGVVDGVFTKPYLVSKGEPLSVDEALLRLGKYGHHGAKEQVEGAVWRVERKGVVDFLCKFVRHDKIDGKYLKETILNRCVDCIK